MITRDLQAVEIEGQLSGEAVDMTIAAEAMAHIMYQLANLYEDNILATVRESATNADDARLLARSGRPTEITLPTRMAPEFKCRDYGTGMSFEDIINIYSKYGASTKRHSNDFNGALGFGCKAPLAYTPQFTVQTVQNGLMQAVSVGRKEDGGGTMNVVMKNVPTSEPAGTLITVPVKREDCRRFEEVAAGFFRFWKPGTVLVDGEEPKFIESSLRLSPRFAVIAGDRDLILMANVAYPTHQRLNTRLPDGYALLAEVPTGDVEFTPSREALKNPSSLNRATLARVTEEFNKLTEGAVQRKIDEADTRSDALKAMIHWARILPGRSKEHTYAWRGNALPSRWHEPKQVNQDWPFLRSPLRSYQRSLHYGEEIVKAYRFARDVFVTGFTPGKFSASHRERLNMWLDDGRQALRTERDREWILVRADEIPTDIKPWIEPARIVSWADIKANYKPQRAVTGGVGSWKQLKGSYEDVWTENGKVIGETPASAIRQTEPIYWFSVSTTYLSHATAVLDDPKFTTVRLSANRIEKFKRDFPAAKPLKHALTESYTKWRNAITEDQRLAYVVQQRTGVHLLKQMDPSLVADPALQRAIHLAKVDLTKPQQRARVYGRLINYEAGEFPKPSGSLKPNVLSAYPLLLHGRVSTTLLPHVYLYVNAVFAQQT